MAHMRGLELVCICKRRAFEIRYEDGRYVDLRGREVEGLLDVTCYHCMASYYTVEGEEEIEFCPNCGRFQRLRFENLSQLLTWSRGQDFSFLRYSSSKVFAVQEGDEWHLAFGKALEAVKRRGFSQVHEVTDV
jgi:hypothetical protein